MKGCRLSKFCLWVEVNNRRCGLAVDSPTPCVAWGHALMNLLFLQAGYQNFLPGGYKFGGQGNHTV